MISLDPNISVRLTGSIIPDSGFSPADVLLNSFLAGEANHSPVVCVDRFLLAVEKVDLAEVGGEVLLNYLRKWD